MILQPTSSEQLTQSLATASAAKQKIESVNLAALNRVLEHTAEDMTVTAQAGMTLAALQAEVGRHRQWLPVDPPHPERLTLHDLMSINLSGPRRFGYGTIRDYVIGLTVALADGTLIHSGGKVVKNVAGYDLIKLFVGAQGSLGVIVEANFKLRPLPELERFTQASCASLDKAGELIEAVIKSELTPVVLDLHNTPTTTLVLGFAGSREEVEWQLGRAAELGFDQPSSLDYAAKFWADAAPTEKLSVLPSRLIETIRALNGAPFIARAGNGVVYHRGPRSPRQEKLPLELMRRVKDAYDPNQIFPALPL
jgi:glycolate oxidase FAD binding subunit